MRDPSLPLALTFFLLGLSAGLVASEHVPRRPTGDRIPARRESSPSPATVPDRELVVARREADRYRQGLVRAVSELNRLAESCRRPTAPIVRADPLAPEPPPAPPASTEPEPSPAKLRLEGPQLQLWGEDLIAFGTVRNSGGSEGWKELVLELVRDGEVIDEARLDLTVPAGGSLDYEHSFWAGELEGSYRVRGRLVDPPELY